MHLKTPKDTEKLPYNPKKLRWRSVLRICHQLLARAGPPPVSRRGLGCHDFRAEPYGREVMMISARRGAPKKQEMRLI